jgi:hypothetical protein
MFLSLPKESPVRIGSVGFGHSRDTAEIVMDFLIGDISSWNGAGEIPIEVIQYRNALIAFLWSSGHFVHVNVSGWATSQGRRFAKLFSAT